MYAKEKENRNKWGYQYQARTSWPYTQVIFKPGSTWGLAQLGLIHWLTHNTCWMNSLVDPPSQANLAGLIHLVGLADPQDQSLKKSEWSSLHSSTYSYQSPTGLLESYWTELGLRQISCWLSTIQILYPSPSGVLVNSYWHDPKSKGIADS